VLYGGTWLLASPSKEPPAATDGRAIDHLGFSFPDLDAVAAELKQTGVTFAQGPRALSNSVVAAKIAFVTGPDYLRIEVVDPPK
jgi:catechol 2,3-dioxygenase-like lactoylglutathione lyase family enzyme